MKYLKKFNESVNINDKSFKNWFGKSIVTECHNNHLTKKWNPERCNIPLVVFHKTKNKDFVKFEDDYDSGNNIFGKGFYFANQSEILGSKVGFEWDDPVIHAYLKLETPLNMNDELSKNEAHKFIEKWTKFAKVPIEFELNWRDEDDGLSWKDLIKDGIQYGDIIQNSLDWSHSEYDEGNNIVYNSIKPFLLSLGYDGLYHYCDTKTDYVNSVSDYTTYVVYNDNQIKRT